MSRVYDFERFCIDYAIDHKEGSRGYIDIHCPFCDSRGKMHGGLHAYKGFYCWRCGYHRIEDVVMALTGMNWFSIRETYNSETDLATKRKEPATRPSKSFLDYPPGTRPLLDEHKKYLAKRNFNPTLIEYKYHLKATGWYGNYAYRIIIPILHKNVLVSYLGRDWTGAAQLRYKACEIEDEIIHHKHILYNMDNAPGEHAVIVEGSTDVWRLGDGAIATLGTGFTQQQLNLIAKTYKRTTLLYDAEEEAKRRANTLGNTLAGVGLDVDMILLREGDPAELPQDEADAIMREILFSEQRK
jgi:hypothetical protein